MADIVSPEKRSRMMAGIKGKDTKPEMVVRRLLHSAGYRYRLHAKGLAGKPDIVLKKYNTVIFVHGCFWHGHQDCHLFRLPKSRTDFWGEKIAKNKARDLDSIKYLRDNRWKVMVVWECAVKGRTRLHPDDLLNELKDFLSDAEKFAGEISGI